MKAIFRTILKLHVAAVLATVGTVAALAQQPQPLSGQSNARQQANEVVLDLVVHDKANKSVLDLQPDQITVTDNGQPVKLDHLRLVNGDKQNEPLITLIFNRPGINIQQKFSEKIAQDASRRLQDSAVRFLKQLPDSGFRISVMDVWGRLQVQQVRSADRKATEHAVAAAVQPGQYGVAVGVTPEEENLANRNSAAAGDASTRDLALAQSISSAIMESSRLAGEQQGSVGLACLQALVQSEQGLVGRKAVVYFTDATELIGDPKGQSPDEATKTKNAIQSILGAANRAGISIYVVRMDQPRSGGPLGSTLDAYAATSTGATESGPTGGKGGASSSSNGFASAVSGQFSGSSEFASINSKESDIAPVPGSLDSLVKGTGGFSFKADDAFPPPVKQLASDLTAYYEASYVLPGNSDGSFHAVTIKPIREGLKLRGRSGYLALSSK